MRPLYLHLRILYLSCRYIFISRIYLHVIAKAYPNETSNVSFSEKKNWSESCNINIKLVVNELYFYITSSINYPFHDFIFKFCSCNIFAQHTSKNNIFHTYINKYSKSFLKHDINANCFVVRYYHSFVMVAWERALGSKAQNITRNVLLRKTVYNLISSVRTVLKMKKINNMKYLSLVFLSLIIEAYGHIMRLS